MLVFHTQRRKCLLLLPVYEKQARVTTQWKLWFGIYQSILEWQSLWYDGLPVRELKTNISRPVDVYATGRYFQSGTTADIGTRICNHLYFLFACGPFMTSVSAKRPKLRPSQGLHRRAEEWHIQYNWRRGSIQGLVNYASDNAALKGWKSSMTIVVRDSWAYTSVFVYSSHN